MEYFLSRGQARSYKKILLLSRAEGERSFEEKFLDRVAVLFIPQRWNMTENKLSSRAKDERSYKEKFLDRVTALFIPERCKMIKHLFDITMRIVGAAFKPRHDFLSRSQACFYNAADLLLKVAPKENLFRCVKTTQNGMILATCLAWLILRSLT